MMQRNRNGIPVVNTRREPPHRKRPDSLAPPLPIPPPPDDLHGKDRWKWRCRERRRLGWLAFYERNPALASCVGRTMRPKRCFDNWLDALIEAHRLHTRSPKYRKFCFPYRCRMGHIHIGGLPNARHMLTGGFE